MRVMKTSLLLILFVFGVIQSADLQSNQSYTSADSGCDPSKAFDCGTYCIPIAWKCDNINDCPNGADEIDCEPIDCEEGELLCDNGSCVPGVYKCDGHSDCSSDENNCEFYFLRPYYHASFNFGDPKLYSNGTGRNKYGCLPGFGFCAKQKICIPNRSFCDGLPDCFHGYEDELHCPREEQGSGISRNNPCYDKFVCKTNETYKDEVCIRMEEVCNGKKECPLGDDESEKCSECSTKKCDHHCINTPTGAKCTCNEGYRLDSDGVKCVDIDECALKKRACHHFCENKIGSFVCSCAKGYYLEEDRVSCKLTNTSGGFILRNFHGEIKRRPLEDFGETNFTSIHQTNGIIQAFDYSRRDDKFFMVVCDGMVCSNGKLVVEEKGKSKVLRENISVSTNLAVDWIGGNLFFTEMTTKPNHSMHTLRISVCTMDGKFCRAIIERTELSIFHGFAIHPMRGLVFFIDHQIEDGTKRIMMANMDGSQVQTLIETNLTIYIRTLAIDYANNDVYFEDMTQRNIRRVNIDTKQTAVIEFNGFYKFQTTDSMVFHNGFLYWTEQFGPLQALEVDSEGARVHTLLNLQHHYQHFNHMVVNDSLHQLEHPEGNPCKQIDCPWICVIVPDFTAKCLCPDGYTLSALGTTCIPPSKEIEKQDNLTHIGFELMSEYCKNGMGCLNGGVCRKVFNNTRIVCDCVQPYDGLYCERRKPIISDETIMSLVPVVLLLLLVFLLGGGVYWFFFYRRNKKISFDNPSFISSNSPIVTVVRYENDAVSLG